MVESMPCLIVDECLSKACRQLKWRLKHLRWEAVCVGIDASKGIRVAAILEATE